MAVAKEEFRKTARTKEQFIQLDKEIVKRLNRLGKKPLFAFAFASPPWVVGGFDLDLAVVFKDEDWSEELKGQLEIVAKQIGEKHQISIDGWCFPLTEFQERMRRITGRHKVEPTICDFANWEGEAFVPLTGPAEEFIRGAFASPLSGGPKIPEDKYKFVFNPLNQIS